MKIDQKAYKHLSQDPTIGKVVKSISLDSGSATGDVYFDLLKSICSQQLSVKAAATIHGRFLNLFNDQYPNPQPLIKTPHDTLRGVGLSNSKALYMKNIAEFFISEKLFDFDWSTQSEDEIINLLTQIKGVGKWTTEMILMFSLQRSDVFPVDDLGIQQAMIRLCALKSEKKQLHQDMIAAAEPWRPYRTTASLYLWAWKDSNK